MKRILLFAFLGLAAFTSFNIVANTIGLAHNYITEPESIANDENSIQVALLLDTSGSMNGLLEQTKSQLWNILNELARTKKNGDETHVEIALYEYGNPRKATSAHQIHRLTPFTTDMDLVSEELFALTTNGGDEYCGAVIHKSINDLDWKNSDGLRMIYVAGNEAFTQGPLSYERACKLASEKGIIVNTIFCGDYNKGVQLNWKSGATVGNGDYLHISHNEETVYIPTPFDDQINDLNVSLNKTYIPYGEKGKSAKNNQQLQDSNASSYSKSNVADRAAYKSSKKYTAEKWDLVDAYKKDKEVLKKAKIHADSLSMLTSEVLEARVQAISTTRSELQSKIQSLDKQRREFKANQALESKTTSLQSAVISTVRKQAKDKGFEIKD